MADPFFSVIVPTHNGAVYIRKALESTMKQTFTDYELIVICDACTDNTQKYVKYVLKDHPGTVRIISVDLHRDGLARNAGLDIASGKYIIFLDDDDWWLHEYVFQQMYDMLKYNNFDVLNYGIIWRTSGYRADPPGVFIPMCAGHVWRRDFIGDTRFASKQYSSDTQFLNDMIRKKPDGIWTALPMYYYNFMRPGSLSDLHKRGEIE